MDTVFEYSELSSSKDAILAQLHNHGFIVVRGVPTVSDRIEAYRQSALAFTRLTDAEKAKCTPENFYAFGWSYGKEKFSGIPDKSKGSYYADFPDCSGNVWPDFSTDEFDGPAFQDNYLKLGELVYGTGQIILDTIGFGLPAYVPKMRMLHYGVAIPKDDDPSAFWCGLHKDHGYFTGLIPALYFNDDQTVPKVEGSGLHIRGQKVTIPEDCLAFQVGETLELASNGKVTSTEHDVRKAYDCERLTFATFISPERDYVIESTVTSNDRYTGTTTYGEFEAATYQKYYS
jgi:isopenicillin N synthase-like dioxygenase